MDTSDPGGPPNTPADARALTMPCSLWGVGEASPPGSTASLLTLCLFLRYVTEQLVCARPPAGRGRPCHPLAPPTTAVTEHGLCPPCQSTPGGETVQTTFQDVSVRCQEAQLKGLGLGPLKAPLLIPVPEFGTALRAPECRSLTAVGARTALKEGPCSEWKQRRDNSQKGNPEKLQILQEHRRILKSRKNLEKTAKKAQTTRSITPAGRAVRSMGRTRLPTNVGTVWGCWLGAQPGGGGESGC